MGSSVESGPLYGRPYGGVMILVKSKLRDCTCIVSRDERYVAVIVGDLLFINVYLPCAGTVNRLLIYENVLQNIQHCIENNPVFGGNLNVDLNECCLVSKIVNEFAEDNDLIRCDKLFPGAYVTSYYNESLTCHSNIDFILTSKADSVNCYYVLDPFANFSDHHPVFVNCVCHISQLSCDDARNT